MNAEEAQIAAARRELHAAGESIDDASDTLLQRKLARFKATNNSRTEMGVVSQQSELSLPSLMGDEAEYELGKRAHASGDLSSAAHWYRNAASNDFADAGLRLAHVLDAMASDLMIKSGGRPAGPEELHLTNEATHWYLTAFGAGDLEYEEVAEYVEQLLSRINPATRPARPMRPVGSQGGSMLGRQAGFGATADSGGRPMSSEEAARLRILSDAGPGH